ncbi:sulfatase-like hydrolase/transferase [Flammeovirga yaeyamensis]|uniref:Sulfatase-like hydrolase/transferase n=1 Tax=Flammeovirga yaeyamensis TaxID=367791 RepID=A0AAX1NC72_9BACT|nr:sulfatase [Flammeovirga yaeyamensis]MBB3696876.1 arylsulfatase A-like enzyme [Flammeovirga yaeyamensis]NMF33541.1 sulfatase [Flammeovirga yaeyamensis]QWG05190.1 sulfatase-like hydrolase/transferase [Flammeovirga yaeyamensis]
MKLLNVLLFLLFTTSLFAQKNVVQIIVDDLGWTDLGCYGSDYYETPSIDALADKSIKFTNSYASCNVCSPTRASIVTGKYPASLNLTDWIEGWKYPKAKFLPPEWTMYLDPSIPTIGQIFKENGYKTAHFGKWHLGEAEKYWPENHGFDENHGGWRKGAPNKNKKAGSNGYFAPYGNPRLEDGPEGEYLTERIASDVCQFLEANKDTTFFVNLWFYNVHTPLQAKQEKVDRYQQKEKGEHHHNATYAAMVEHVDDATGVVLTKLDELGLMENTIIIFSSDNGGLHGKKKRPVTSNYPLRGGKGMIYEGGIRIPTMIYHPQHNARIESTSISSIDYLPTLVDLAGVNVNKKIRKDWDGTSLANLVTNEKEVDRPLFWHYPHYHQQGAVPHTAILDGDWKLIHNIELDKYELYNVKEDISEKNNCIDSHQGVYKKLLKKMEAWKKEVNAQMPVHNPNYQPSK